MSVKPRRLAAAVAAATSFVLISTMSAAVADPIKPDPAVPGAALPADAARAIHPLAVPGSTPNAGPLCESWARARGRSSRRPSPGPPCGRRHPT
ncbi:hypothetical protein [Phytohabitans suffuscus]|uniref:hypothetical protein n=1 Tax=Phytohabitans suffuscus TaxID=624315 RepID=UPI001566D726|nr:hypothetical protein [Phytohabitans suffuscus]